MLSKRTIAGVGAAALAFLALSRISRRCRNQAGECAGEFVKRAAGRVEGIIRRRNVADVDVTNDVI